MTKQMRRGAGYERMVIDLLLAHGNLDRAGIARLAGVSRPSAGEIVGRLTDAGFVVEAGEDDRPRRGPNSLLYGLRRGVAQVAGVELQPEVAWAEIADLDGTGLGVARCAALAGEPPELLAERVVAQAARDAAIDPRALAAVTVAAPGIVGPDGDMTYVEGHPAWNAGLRDRLEAALAVPVRLENDVKLTAVAEQRHGAATGVDSFALLRLGESVSAAIVLDGRVVRGATGAAGEVGYQVSRGPVSWRGADVSAAVDAGTALTPLFPDAAAAMVSVCSVVDPELVVVSGPAADVTSALAGLLQEFVHATTPFRPRVTFSALGTESGSPAATGATTRALDEVRDRIYGIAPQFHPATRPL